MGHVDDAAADVVHVRLPRNVNRAWEIALLAGLVLPTMGAQTWFAPVLAPGFAGVVRTISVAAGASTAIGACVLLLRSARVRRRANETVERAAAGGLVSDEELCVAAAVLGGARRGSVRRLRRAHLDAVEEAARRVLPRVWLLDKSAARSLAMPERNDDESGEESWFVVAASPMPFSKGLVEGAAVVGTLAASIAVEVAAARGWLGRPSKLVHGLLGMFGGAIVAAPVYWFFRGAGWRLRTTLERAELLLLDRRGEPARPPIEIDPIDTFVLVSKRGEDAKVEGKVAWRLLPPSPAPAIDAADLRSGLTPWSAAGRQHPAL
ncbi:MAG: hypothetical protein FJ255_00065 [Phycisphaerae bacterium]|nr:hypothetical protein [Phycisphaerae bacterium]